MSKSRRMGHGVLIAFSLGVATIMNSSAWAGGSLPPAPTNDTPVMSSGDEATMPIEQGIAGQVLSKTKGPLANVTIQPIAEGDTPPIRIELAYMTDDKGKFSIAVGAGTWTIRAIVDGKNYDQQHIAVAAKTVAEISIETP